MLNLSSSIFTQFKPHLHLTDVLCNVMCNVLTVMTTREGGGWMRCGEPRQLGNSLPEYQIAERDA